MKQSFKSFFMKIIICATLGLMFVSPGILNANIPSGDIGDFGAWSTPHNQSLITTDLATDIEAFQKKFQDNLKPDDYVPIEARLGRVFIGAMSMISDLMEKSLIRFVTIFMIIMFIFWTMLEAYKIIRGDGDPKETVEGIIKKAVLITVWVLVLEQGPAKIFMWIVGPIISIGTSLSDLILNSVSSAAKANLPDTCIAIHKYMAANPTGSALIDSKHAADILCVPTRLSGFFYTAVSAGFKWMWAGIGTSAFTFVTGLVFVIIFLYNIWKFALITLGIVADLLIGIIMLPFTAIANVFGDIKYDYKGNYFGEIFKEFMNLFKGTESIEKQVMRFINAILYFVSLSIVIAVCAALLSGVVDANLSAEIPSLENNGFMVTLIVGCLVAYLASKAETIVQDLGGSYDKFYTDKFSGDAKKALGGLQNTAKNIWKVIRKK